MKRGFEFTSSPTDRSRTIKLSTVTEDSINLHDRLIRKAFNSVTTQILELVQHQVEQVKKATDGKLPRAILVVGGFGRCPFVRGALKHKFSGGGAGNGSSQGSRAPKRAKKSVDNAIHIMSDTGEMPWTAICRGAVLAKLADNSRIESRKARMSFGFVQSVYAAEGEEGTWDNLFGRHMVKNAMTWILRRVSLTFHLSINQTSRTLTVLELCTNRETVSPLPTKSSSKPSPFLLRKLRIRITKLNFTRTAAKSRQHASRTEIPPLKNLA